jgi:hypothetical protein
VDWVWISAKAEFVVPSPRPIERVEHPSRACADAGGVLGRLLAARINVVVARRDGMRTGAQCVQVPRSAVVSMLRVPELVALDGL